MWSMAFVGAEVSQREYRIGVNFVVGSIYVGDLLYSYYFLARHRSHYDVSAVLLEFCVCVYVAGLRALDQIG